MILRPVLPAGAPTVTLPEEGRPPVTTEGVNWSVMPSGRTLITCVRTIGEGSVFTVAVRVTFCPVVTLLLTAWNAFEFVPSSILTVAGTVRTAELLDAILTVTPLVGASSFSESVQSTFCDPPITDGGVATKVRLIGRIVRFCVSAG